MEQNTLATHPRCPYTFHKLAILFLSLMFSILAVVSAHLNTYMVFYHLCLTLLQYWGDWMKCVLVCITTLNKTENTSCPVLSTVPLD